jgi:hypothetical protein
MILRVLWHASRGVILCMMRLPQDARIPSLDRRFSLARETERLKRPEGAWMSGNEIALTAIIVIAAFALLFAFVISRWEKVPRKEP